MTEEHTDGDASLEMPFLDHLEELRWRILKSLGALVVGVGLAFYLLLQFDVLTALQKPILPSLGGRKLVYTHPGDPFSIVMNAAFIIGGILALPVIVHQVWSFVAPALFRHEKRVVMGVFFFAILLFFCGAAFAWFLLLPLVFPWLMSFGGPAFEPMITASEYFGFAMSIVLTLGVAFELPIVILALAALGIVTPQLLNQYRRHVIVAVVIIGAFLTPGDLVITTIVVAVALWLLFELSVLLSYYVYRRRTQRIAAREAEQAG